MELDLLASPLAIIRLAPSELMPEWTAAARVFLSVTRTAHELSIVADVTAVPTALQTAVTYRAFRVRGPLQHNLVGVFSALATPLALAGIPIFPIATFDTDYLLVGVPDIDAAVHALSAAGHHVMHRDA